MINTRRSFKDISPLYGGEHHITYHHNILAVCLFVLFVLIQIGQTNKPKSSIIMEIYTNEFTRSGIYNLFYVIMQ